MSVFRKRTNGHRTVEKSRLDSAINDVAAVIANGGTKYMSAEMAASAISMEGINDASRLNLDRAAQSLIADLRGTSLVDLLGISKDISPEAQTAKLEASLEACAYTILASQDAGNYYAKGSSKVSNSFDGKGHVVMPSDGHTDFAMESFEPVSVAKYLAATAVANAQATVAGGFEDVWFPQQLVPAGQNGVDVEIVIPKVYSTTMRSTDGTPFSLEKKSLIEALLTPDMLESEATTIVPYASSTTLPATLVPAAQIPDEVRVVDNIDVPTRPIKFGAEVDLIGISNAPGLIKVGVLDETDALDPIINIGTVYYKLEIVRGATTTTSYMSADISSQIGTLLTQVQAGKGQEYQTTASPTIFINNDNIVSLNGDTKGAVVSAIEGVLGIAAGTKFNIAFNMKLSANANTETGFALVNSNNCKVTHIYNALNESVSLDPLSAPGVSFVIEPLGYFPQARRTNSALRQNGTIIDVNTLVTYRFPVSLSAPIISQAPIGSTNNVTLEGLGHAARIRQNGRAVKAFENMEKALASSNGIPSQSPIMGAEYVVPTYLKNTLDVSDMVTTMNSADNLANLRGQILAAMTNMVNQALLLSHYLAALEMTTGDISAFEIIVVTDPQIAPHLWEPGDIRSFGDSRKYIITQSNNVFFQGKIYFSFRRSGGGEEIHPLDFGRMLVTPPLTYDVAISRNGRTVNEIHTVPRVQSFVTLPILMKLEIKNLESIYVGAQP